MRRRDIVFTSVILILTSWCVRFHQEVTDLHSQIEIWEQSRFEMTRILADLQTRLDKIVEQSGFRGLLLPRQESVYKLNLLPHENFGPAFLKYAQNLKLMALSFQAGSPAGSLETGAENSSDENFPNVWPTQGTITSLFGLRKHPILKSLRFHSGVDIANLKNTEILAAAGGSVKFAGPDGGYGNTVILDHGNGFESVYGHAEGALVKTGETIKKGQLIASMGSTGLSTGEHLHFEIRFAGEALDPTVFVK